MDARQNANNLKTRSDSQSAFSRIFNSLSSILPDSMIKERSIMPLRRSSRLVGKNTESSNEPQTSTRNDQRSMPQTPLYNAIDNKSFWSMPDDDLLVLIRDEFPNELGRLKTAYSVKATGIPRPKTPSISHRLYGEEYDEINRTLLGVLALRWIHFREYKTFIGDQSPSSVVLTSDSFTWICDTFDAGLHTTDDIYTLVLSMIINDLGKDKNLAPDYAALKSIDISHVNHDMILLHAVDAGMVPALDTLTPSHLEDMLVGIKLGAEFNFGQLAQGENAPASLSGLVSMQGHNRAFQMRFMEQILDLSGASGHEDWTCARKMTEPIFQSYKNVHDVASSIISGKVNLRDGYDIILTRKLDLLHTTGYKKDFDIKNPTDRALLRLFCLGNTNNPQNADLYDTAFTSALDTKSRHQLIEGLNRDGSVEFPAVQPTYSPAMLTKATANTLRGTAKEKIKAVTAVLRYMAKCFDVSDAVLGGLPEGVTVIERDMRVVDKVVEGQEFRRNPDVLDLQDVPTAQVANMAK